MQLLWAPWGPSSVTSTPTLIAWRKADVKVAECLMYPALQFQKMV